MVGAARGETKGTVAKTGPIGDAAIRMFSRIGIHGIAGDDWLNAILFHFLRGLEHGFQGRVE